MKEGEALEHSWLNRTIANAQKKVEGMHYDARKHFLNMTMLQMINEKLSMS